MIIQALLDTNICIYLIKNKDKSLLQKFLKFEPGELAISSISLAELEYGISKSSRVEENRAALKKFVRPLEIVNFDEVSASVYGSLRVKLEKKGQPIGGHDMLIASQAIALKIPLVTNNEKEFKRIENLTIENWCID